MKKVADLVKLFQRGYTDVLGLDLGGSGAKAVRLRMIDNSISVAAADILPRQTLSAAGTAPVAPLDLPKTLRARYVALTTSDSGALVKLLAYPIHSEKSADAHVYELMGLGESTDYRLAYEPVAETRSEVKVLAVAMPVQTIGTLCHLFPSGVPAPCAIEVSGLASMTAYARGPGRNHAADCVAVVDFGASVTLVAFFNKGVMVLIRKFDIGTGTILKRLQDNLGVDADVASGILNDGSFDISQIVRQAMDAFLQQLIISWEFVERRENTRISRLYACGGGSTVKSWAHEIHAVTGQTPALWNPFEGIGAAQGSQLEKWKGQEVRFAAAMGAALGTLEVK